MDPGEAPDTIYTIQSIPQFFFLETWEIQKKSLELGSSRDNLSKQFLDTGAILQYLFNILIKLNF